MAVYDLLNIIVKVNMQQLRIIVKAYSEVRNLDRIAFGEIVTVLVYFGFLLMRTATTCQSSVLAYLKPNR